MITLYTTLPKWGLLSISPACMKLETWLCMAKLPYQRISDTHLHIEKAPKGKLPFIDYQGKIVGDSTLIIEMFKEIEGIDLDRGLAAGERAISLAFRRMLKENTYWGIAYIRYEIPENWKIYREVIADVLCPGSAPSEWEPLVERFGDYIRAQLHSQGMGRHSHFEICQIIKADLQALSNFLAEKPLFMGDEPTTLDATAYAFIGNIIKPPFSSPIVDYARQLDNLCRHYKRMQQTFL